MPLGVSSNWWAVSYWVQGWSALYRPCEWWTVCSILLCNWTAEFDLYLLSSLSIWNSFLTTNINTSSAISVDLKYKKQSFLQEALLNKSDNSFDLIGNYHGHKVNFHNIPALCNNKLIHWVTVSLTKCFYLHLFYK